MQHNFDRKTDNELMHEFSKCSSKAFEEIMNRYKKRLFNYLICGLLPNRQEAEDVVQETFIRAYKCKFTYKFTYQFSTWIYTICRNLALNTKRNNKSVSLDQETFEKMPTQAPDNSLEENEVSKIMKEVLSRLDKKYRDIITLRYLEGLSYKEISEITGIGENTLKSHCKRALEFIRKEMEKMEIEK